MTRLEKLVLVAGGFWLFTRNRSTPAIPAGGDIDPGSSGDDLSDLFYSAADPVVSGAATVFGATVANFSLPQDVSDLIEQYAAQYGVDPNLAKAQAWVESRGNQNAVSPAGAIGVFQLMPATAAGLGVDPNDLDQNVQGGIMYLAQLLSRYGGNTALALAAYNAGPGNVNKYGGIPPFAETENYVSKILGMVGAG